MAKPARLDLAFVSDVACPWCAIGLASLEQALARLGSEFETTLHIEPKSILEGDEFKAEVRERHWLEIALSRDALAG